MRNLQRILLALCCAASLHAAGEYRENIIVTPSDRFLSQVVDGASWATTFLLTNMSTSPINYLLRLFDSTGSSLPVPFEGFANPATGIFGNIPVGQSILLSTVGTSAQLIQGWAVITTYDRPANQQGAVVTNDLIGGIGVFRQRIAGRPDFEAVVPVNRGEKNFLLPFDNRNNFSTGISLVNVDFTTMPVTITGRGLDGTILFQDTVSMAGGEKLVFSMPTRYPNSNNRVGVMQVTTPGTLGVSALGLRFNPTGAFTSFHTLAPTGQ